MGKRIEMKKMILLILYVLCSAFGLTLMKLGVDRNFALGIEDGTLYARISIITLGGIFLYVCSFLLSIQVMAKMNITYFYPISSGLIYIFICVLGVALLKEVVSVNQWIGAVLILSGVIVMNIQQ